MHTPSPRIIRQNIRLAVVLILLALAALWLRPLRVRAAELPADGGGAAQPDAPAERFVPGGMPGYAGATLELRPEVTVLGDAVKLRNVCRWADSDKAAFEPVADLVLMRVPKGSPFRTITMRELRDTLTSAGVNLAVVRLAGATTCTVARTDVKYDERTALDQWIAAREGGQAKPPLIEAPRAIVQAAPAAKRADVTIEGGATQGAVDTRAVRPVEAVNPVAVPPIPPAEPRAEAKATKSLRDLLVAEAAERLGLMPEDIQAHFNPADDRVLNLAEPLFKFGINAPRRKLLGDQTWEVTIVAEGAVQKASVSATLRAWQRQAVIARPIGSRQVIGADDVIERRALVDQIVDDALLAKDQAIGQMASRDLRTGTILTARLVEAPLMIKPGQMVTITIGQGGVSARSVARAMEQGTLGQTVRVRNEATGNTFEVVVTGPQAGTLSAGAGGSADIVIR